MKQAWYLKSFVGDINSFCWTFLVDDRKELRRKIRIALEGWKVKFSGHDRVYAVRGKERRHFFLDPIV